MSRERKDGRKEAFTVLGEFKPINGRNEFVPYSAAHYRHNASQARTGVQYAAVFEQYKATRSDQQLRYHWVLVGYIAEYTGTTREEMHDALMRLKFGTKKVTLGGITTEVRRSIAGHAHMTKAEVAELIDYDFEIAASLGLKIPTMAELGYLPH